MILSEIKARLSTYYHGSNRSDLKVIKANPSNYKHGGAIGAGIYVSPNVQTAEYYGRYIYEVKCSITKPLYITPDTVDFIDVDEYNAGVGEDYDDMISSSVLVGENITPFRIKIGKQVHQILDKHDLYSIGNEARSAGHDAVIMEGMRGHFPDDEILLLKVKSLKAKRLDSVFADNNNLLDRSRKVIPH